MNFILGNIVATFFNATLITFEHPNASDTASPPYPIMFPYTNVFGGVFQVDHVYRKYSIVNPISKIIEGPSFDSKNV